MKEISDKLIIVQRQLTILVLSLIVLVLAFQICAFFADILRIVGISILFSYLLINLVDWLSKFVRVRAAAVLMVYTLVTVVLIVGVLVLIPAVMSQVSQLISTSYDQLPQLVESLTKAMLPIEKRLHAAQIELKAIDILNGLVADIPKIEAGTLFNRVSDVAFSTVGIVLYGLSIFVISFYFLLDGYRLQHSLIRLFARRHEAWLENLALEIDKSLQSFFRGQIVLGLGFGAFMILVFAFFGVRYALLLGLFLGIWEIIPVIGPPIGFIPALISVAVHGMENHLHDVNRLTQLLIIFAVFQGFQWLKDNVVAPRYIGNVIGLHPVTIFIAIMIGARMDGILGIIFALPAACAINVMINHLQNNQGISADAVAADAGAGEKT